MSNSNETGKFPRTYHEATGFKRQCYRKDFGSDPFEKYSVFEFFMFIVILVMVLFSIGTAILLLLTFL